MIINIIGMGEIGTAIYDEMNKRMDNKGNIGIYNTNMALIGSEIDAKRRKNLLKNYKVQEKIVKNADVYIIAVYTTEQVLEVLENILKYSKKKRPLVSIESTIDPNQFHKIKVYNENFHMVLFPHRFNPKDSEHKIFNLNRVMGVFDEDSLSIALKFYSFFMKIYLIHIYDPEIVALTKPLENAYRFVEIVLAQEIYLLCKNKKLDFEKVRKAIRTKWNIDCKKALKGVGGKCLPKDTEIIEKYSDNDSLFWSFLRTRNMLYKISKDNYEE